jgi:hypothetical protein
MRLHHHLLVMLQLFLVVLFGLLVFVQLGATHVFAIFTELYISQFL